MPVDQQDPEDRIADLERQLAEQQRINELQQRLADAKSDGVQSWSVSPSVQVGGFSSASEQKGMQYAEDLLNSLRSGTPNAAAGLQPADIDRLRAALSQAAGQAGMSPEQLNEALKHANIDVRTSHSVFYPGQGGAWNMVAWNPSPATGMSYSQPAFVARPRRRMGGLFTALAVILFVSVMFGSVGTLVMPSTALWTSAIVCGSPGQLTHTSEYADRQGQSVDFHCAGADTHQSVNIFLIAVLQTLAAMPIAGLGVLAWWAIRRSR